VEPLEFVLQSTQRPRAWSLRAGVRRGDERSLAFPRDAGRGGCCRGCDSPKAKPPNSRRRWRNRATAGRSRSSEQRLDRRLTAAAPVRPRPIGQVGHSPSGLRL